MKRILAALALILLCCHPALANPMFAADGSVKSPTSAYSLNGTSGQAAFKGETISVLGTAGAYSAGFYGLPTDGLGSTSGNTEYYTWSGGSTAPRIGRQISVLSPGVNHIGNAAADYGLSITAQKANWLTSTVQGEIDPLVVHCFQGGPNSDCAGILTTVAARDGFGSAFETYTFGPDASGNPTTQIDLQGGVVNTHTGINFGLLAQINAGSMTDGILVQTTGSAATSWAYRYLTPAGALWGLRGDGTMFAPYVLPYSSGGGQVGSAALPYAGMYTNTAFTLEYDTLSGWPSTSVPSPTAAQISLFVDSADNKLKTKNSAGIVNVIAAQGCANILLYNGDNTGANDNAASFAAALAAQPAGHMCVYLPAGTYKFASTPTISLTGAYTSATVMGDGAESTRLIYASANLNGLAITLNAATESFHVRDVSILAPNASTTNTGISVTLNASGVPNGAGTPMQSDISGVTLRGSDGYNATNQWATNISLYQVSNVNFNDDAIFGSSTGASTGTMGITISGTAAQIPIQFNITGSQIDFVGVGFNWGKYTQGVSILSTNFVGDGIGINQASTSQGNDQLSVHSSQFNCLRDIFLQQVSDGVSIIGNDFYLEPNGPAAVETTGGQYLIVGNTFTQTQGGTNGTAIAIDQWTMDAGVITGNSIGTTGNGFATGVLLGTSSQHVNVQSNVYTGNSQNVVNNGTNNAVGGGSASLDARDLPRTFANDNHPESLAA